MVIEGQPLIRTALLIVSSSTSSSVISLRAQRYTGPFGSLVALFTRRRQSIIAEDIHLQGTKNDLGRVLPALDLSSVSHILPYNRGLVGDVCRHNHQMSSAAYVVRVVKPLTLDPHDELILRPPQLAVGGER